MMATNFQEGHYMIFRTIRIFILLLFTSFLLVSQEKWGLLICSNNKTSLYSTQKLDKSEKYKVYEIENFSIKTDISILNSQKNEESPFFDAEGNCSSWEHQIAKSNALKMSSIWLCIPAEWQILKSEKMKAKVKNNKGSEGSIRIIEQAEGLEININFKNKKEKAYYYFGY